MTMVTSPIYLILRHALHSAKLPMRRYARSKKLKNYGWRLHEQRENLFRLRNIGRLYTNRYQLKATENIFMITTEQLG